MGLCRFADKRFLNDQTAFFRSVQRDNLDEVKLALKTICEVNYYNTPSDAVNSLRLKSSGDTALHVCARNGFVHMMKYFVSEENANLEQINLDGKTAMHDAAQFSQLEVVNYLLEKGANVNVVKRADWTPLMLACTKPNLEIVKCLVTSGADLSFVNKDGWTCLHIAAREGNADIVAYLLGSCNATEDMKNKKSRNGRKPIHTAGERIRPFTGQIVILQFLMHGHLDTVKLLSVGVTRDDFNEEDTCGSTPLMDACRCGHQDIVKFFVDDIQVNPHHLNNTGVGLLHISSEANQSQIVEILSQNYNVDVNQPSKLLNFTPLHWASREGHIEVVKTLLRLGAFTNVKDAKGRTPQDVAMELQKKDIVDLLQQ